MPSLLLLTARSFTGLALAALAVVAAAQSAPASSPTAAYRSDTVPTVGPDVDLSNTGRAEPVAPVGVAPATGSDTLGSVSGTPTPIGQPAPMGGFGPLVQPGASATADAASAAAQPQAEAPQRRPGRRQKEGTGPDGTPNPGGNGVVIISPQR
jgi:hypothetical protein